MPIGLDQPTSTAPARVGHLVVSMGDLGLLKRFLLAYDAAVDGAWLAVVFNALAKPNYDEAVALLRSRAATTALHMPHNTGWVGGVNIAYKELSGKELTNVCCWHDDMVAGANWSRLAAWQGAKTGLICPSLVEDNDFPAGDDAAVFVKDWLALSAALPPTGDPDGLLRGPWLVNLAAIADLGGDHIFDPAYAPFGYAEWDLYERLLARGWWIGRAPDVYAHHRWAAQHELVTNHAEHIAHNRALYMGRWPDGAWLRYTRHGYVPAAKPPGGGPQ